MKYLISKAKYNGEVICLDIDKFKGYAVSPKNNLKYDGIKVQEMVIIKPSLIEKIIKRKIKMHLDLYIKFILEESDDDDTRKALGSLERYRVLINDKYSLFLDLKYLKLLNKKIDILQRELNSNLEVRKRR